MLLLRALVTLVLMRCPLKVRLLESLENQQMKVLGGQLLGKTRQATVAQNGQLPAGVGHLKIAVQTGTRPANNGQLMVTHGDSEKEAHVSAVTWQLVDT